MLRLVLRRSQAMRGTFPLRQLSAASSSFEMLAVERLPEDERVLSVAFDRPEALNALNTQMAVELRTLFDPATLDSAEFGDVRAVVLSGGEGAARAFCVGADLKERKGMTDEQWSAQHRIFQQAGLNILHCPVPVISAVEGEFTRGYERLRRELTSTLLGDNARHNRVMQGRGLQLGPWFTAIRAHCPLCCNSAGQDAALRFLLPSYAYWSSISF